MYRLLLCLPICLLMAPYSPEPVHEFSPTEGRSFADEPLPAADPVHFLEKCIQRYDEERISGYTAVLHKQERLQGRLQPSELIDISFRQKPYSVFMHWVKGEKMADSVLYVQGQNDDKLLVHPSGLAGRLVKVVTRDPEGAEARQSGRYSLRDFGFKKSTERTYRDWKGAQEKGELKVKYLGVRRVYEVGDRPCYTLHRTHTKPDKEGVTDVLVYIDKDTWLQVGTVLKGVDGKLIGEYMFRDVHLNPHFKPGQFESAALTM
jgi:Protein of unknown function (DUF1571)